MTAALNVSVCNGDICVTVTYAGVLWHLTGSFLGLGAKIATPSSLDDDVDDPVQHSPEIGEHDDDGEEFLRDHSKVVPHADDPQGPPLHEEGGDKQAH